MAYYKIENNKAQVGNKPHGAEWIEYTVGQEPQELIDALNYKTPEEWQAVFVDMTDKHIQSEVDKYNLANGVLFSSIHNCHTYASVAGYPHQAFCINIVQWNSDIWTAVRNYQIAQTALGTIPTVEEFQAVLDGVVFNG